MRKSSRERKRVIKDRSNIFLKFNGFFIDSVLSCGRVENRTMKNQIITKKINSALLWYTTSTMAIISVDAIVSYIIGQ